MRVLLVIAFILLIIALGVVIPSLLFIGIGHVISLVIKLTLFDATVLCAVSTFVFYFILVTILYTLTERINIEGYINENIRKEKRKSRKSRIHEVK
jgi:membrane protein implicated in regulation of membrane protease activity